MQTTQDRVQKLVTFSPKLYSKAIARANSLGIPFAEYVRHTLIKDVEESTRNLPMVDAETEKRIGQSLKDLEEGRFTVIKNKKELDTHLSNL
ncbi:MAG: hypothetical protein Q7K55_05660 [Candidatus Levybacteria bacterium]|nr:hypothetical protein [Candidatus Levybacteria bacterium]